MGFFKKMSEKGKDIYGKGQKMYNEFEKQQAINRAKELQRLRKERIKLEGKARLEKLRLQEQEKILKARQTLGQNQNKKDQHKLSL